MAFNYQAARQAGYTDEEINSFLRNQGSTVLNDLTVSPAQKPFTLNTSAARAAGYSPEAISEYGRGERTGIPGMAGANDEPFLSKLARFPGQALNFVGNVVLPRGISTAKQIGGSLLLQKNLPALQQRMENNQRQIVALQEQARRNPQASTSTILSQGAQNLSNESQNMVNEYLQAAGRQAGVTNQTKLAGDFGSALTQGLGVGGEIGALMVPAYGRGGLTAGARVGGAIKSGALAGGLLGFTNPENENLGQIAGNTAKGAAVAAATSGVLSAGGELLRKVAGAKPKALSTTPSTPETATKVDVVAGPSDRLSMGGKAYRSQFTVPTKLADRLKPNETVNQMMKYNVVGSLDDLADKTEMVTGANGAITKMSRDALAFGNATIDKVDDALTSAAQQASISPYATPQQQQIALRRVTDVIGSLKSGGQVLQNAPPGVAQAPLTMLPANAVDVYDAVKVLESMGYEELGKSTYLTSHLDAEDIGHIYLAAADALEQKLNATAGKTALDAVKTPENLQRLAEVSPLLAKEVMAAKTWEQMRGLAAPFVRLNKMIKLTDAAAMSAFNGLAGAITGPKGIAAIDLTKPGSWVQPFLERQDVNTVGGTLLDKLSQAKQGPMGQFVTKAIDSLPANALMRGLSLGAARSSMTPPVYH